MASWPYGRTTRLSNTQRETIDAVLAFYGKKSAQWLSELTRREAPWKDARTDLGPGERGGTEITHASMAEYYASL